jgi:hypothetical protein
MSILKYQTGGVAQDPRVGQTTGYQGALAEFAGDYVTDFLGKGRALADQPYQAYTGPLTAGQSQLQDTAFSGLGNLVVPTTEQMSFTPGTFSATDAPAAPAAGAAGAAPTAGGTNVNQYMNPYLSAVLQPQLAEARRQAEISRQAEAGKYTRAGAFGGSRQALADLERDAILNRTLADITGKGYAAAFQQGRDQFNIEQGRQQTATDAARRFGLEALAAQSGAGRTQREIEQAGILADRAQFEEERDFPYKQVQYQRSLLQDLPIAARSYSVTQPSGLSALLGSTGDVSSLIQSLFGLGGKEEKDTSPGSYEALYGSGAGGS